MRQCEMNGNKFTIITKPIIYSTFSVRGSKTCAEYFILLELHHRFCVRFISNPDRQEAIKLPEDVYRQRVISDK